MLRDNDAWIFYVTWELRFLRFIALSLDCTIDDEAEKRQTLLFLTTALVLVCHNDFLCACQSSVDRESPINDYTIREGALNCNTF